MDNLILFQTVVWLFIFGSVIVSGSFIFGAEVLFFSFKSYYLPPNESKETYESNSVKYQRPTVLKFLGNSWGLSVASLFLNSE